MLNLNWFGVNYEILTLHLKDADHEYGIALKRYKIQSKRDDQWVQATQSEYEKNKVLGSMMTVFNWISVYLRKK